MGISVKKVRDIAVWGCLVCLFPVSAYSQERPSADSRRRQIPLESLPAPPEELAKWIRLGHVRFFTGGQAPSDWSGRRLDAATTYKYQYLAPRQCKWTTRHVPGAVQVVVNVQYDKIRLTPSHEVWFRRPPKPSRFWQDPLVRHELDHVRISTDARWQKQFAQSIRAKEEFTHNLSAATREVRLKVVNRWIDQFVKEQFEKLNSLIDIRYRELDRWTAHGRRRLPENITIESLIRSPSQGQRVDSADEIPTFSDGRPRPGGFNRDDTDN